MLKTIPGYGNYMASDDGRIYSKHTGIYLKQRQNRGGYSVLNLRSDQGNIKTVSVHQLIAKAHIPNNNFDRKYVNHINSIRDDNRVENLEWCTAKENMNHALKFGNFRPSFSNEKGFNKGTRNPRNRLTEEDVLDIRMFFENNISMKDIARVYGVAYETIRSITNRRNWSWL